MKCLRNPNYPFYEFRIGEMYRIGSVKPLKPLPSYKKKKCYALYINENGLPKTVALWDFLVGCFIDNNGNLISA